FTFDALRQRIEWSLQIEPHMFHAHCHDLLAGFNHAVDVSDTGMARETTIKQLIVCLATKGTVQRIPFLNLPKLDGSDRYLSEHAYEHQHSIPTNTELVEKHTRPEDDRQRQFRKVITAILNGQRPEYKMKSNG